METRNIFLNLSPLDHRYFVSNRDLFEKLSLYLSEEAGVRYTARAEIALMKAHLELRGKKNNELFDTLSRVAEAVDPNEVYQEEEKTKHNIRALVNVLKKMVPPETASLVHMGATSVDILDTAFAMRIRDCVKFVVLPLLKDVELTLCNLAEKEAHTPQVGRTHGQHAVPITFGFAMAEYVARLGKSILEIKRLSTTLCGKLAGATGSYNALSMSYSDPYVCEKLYLDNLGLSPSEHSTQLVEPEYLLRLLIEINIAFGVVANLADDLRHLQRSEIDEIREFFDSTQVGSSTMPQKRNPWNSEHVKSLWKEFFPRVQTFFMDQISEHQRDLTNSASQRFIVEYIAGFCAALNRMLSVLKSLHINSEKMLLNLSMTGGSVLAEPAYILLSESGIADAHEVIRKITLESEKEKINFQTALKNHPDVYETIMKQLSTLGYKNPLEFFSEPQNYTGQAASKALELAKKYSLLMKNL